MKIYKPSEEALSTINFKEISIALTGDSEKIRKSFIPVEFRPAFKNLERYMVRFINNNSKVIDDIPRVEISGIGRSKRILVKVPKTISKFKILQILPKDAAQIQSGLWKFGEKFYTTKFSVTTGFEIREYYELEEAKKYIGS